MGLPESISSWNLIYLSLGFVWTISLIVFGFDLFPMVIIIHLFFQILITVVVVSICKIIVSLVLVLLKIWSKLVAFTWRVMGGAILQLIVLSVFLIALRCRNIDWYLLILQFDPALLNCVFFVEKWVICAMWLKMFDTTDRSSGKFVKLDIIILSIVLGYVSSTYVSCG